MFVSAVCVNKLCVVSVAALHHEGPESAADDLGGHAGLQQEEGNGPDHLECTFTYLPFF